jgi:RTX calcium-binding nonapeptide repeat (4 copies)
MRADRPMVPRHCGADAVHVLSLLRRSLLTAAVASLAVTATASANTSHAGWPEIDGLLVMHKADESGEIQGHPTRHNELLGGHGDDVIHAGGAGDVLWGDYKPSGQPETQIDQLIGGPGKDFIYAGHGRNVIVTGAGHDVVHAHFGRGEIHCGPGATVFLSHSSRRLYKLDGCRRISYRTLGY